MGLDHHLGLNHLGLDNATTLDNPDGGGEPWLPHHLSRSSYWHRLDILGWCPPILFTNYTDYIRLLHDHCLEIQAPH